MLRLPSPAPAATLMRASEWPSALVSVVRTWLGLEVGLGLASVWPSALVSVVRT